MPNRPPRKAVSPTGCEERARDDDAESVDSSVAGRTEDDVVRRPARSGGRGPVGRQSSAVALETPAPDFEINDFAGTPFRLSRLRGDSNVLLVFNRGFM